MFIPLPRLTVLVPSGPVSDPDRKHLYVVLTNPTVHPKEGTCVAWVSMRSVVPNLWYDQSCILNIGDHPFIKHPTWVDYGRAGVFPVDKIERGIHSGILAQKDPLSEMVFRRITGGLCSSSFTPEKVKDFYLFASL